MEIIINQILCGEDEKGGFGLLKSTFKDIQIAKKLAFHSDIQDQDNGVVWESTVRGLMVDDYFLIMKTFPDRSPEVRRGRVFSHVLVVSKIELKFLIDLDSVLCHLPNSINKDCPIEPIIVNIKKNEETKNFNSIQGRINKVIHGHANIEKYSNTIVWVGMDNFEATLSRYWKILSIEEKEKLNFGLYFNADAVPKNNLNFICIQKNTESRFSNKGFCIVNIQDNFVLENFYEQLLGGVPEAVSRVSMFRKLCEINEISKEAINKIGIVIETFEDFDSINDLKKLNSLSSVIAEYSPLKSKGSNFKEKLLDKICDLIGTCQVADLHIVRIFKTNTFENSEVKLKKSLGIWLSSFLFSEYESKKTDFSQLFEKLKTTNSENWWNIYINQEISQYLSDIDVTKASIVFNWLNKNISILDYIESFIDNSSKSEIAFISQLNKKNIKPAIKELIDFSLRKNWLRFHAKLMFLEYSFEEAIVKQLEVDKQEDYFEGINEIIINIPPVDIIRFTIENGDKRLIRICGDFCHKKPNLLEIIDSTKVIWQEIWLTSIDLGNTVSDGIPDVRSKIFNLFDSVLEGKEYSVKLIEKVSESDYGDILNYYNRERIWNCFSSTAKTNFLQKTSTALLQALSINSTIVVPEDIELEDYILKHGISTFLYYNRNNFKAALPIFLTFSQLSENILRDYIVNYYGSIDVVNATQLGQLTLRKNYFTVAHVIYQKSYSIHNFRISLNECSSLLNTSDRFWAWAKGLLSHVSITENEWWETFSELCIRLYPSGPKQDKIWERANGDESYLITHSTGRETWLEILKKLRNGGCDDVTPKKLIKTMLEDYKKNEELKTLKDLFDKI
ncbi:MAG: hypothetical protein KUL78_07955 [Flavobacterium sp.]|nr:hypothetical protein [Flavobacterium sp.]